MLTEGGGEREGENVPVPQKSVENFRVHKRYCICVEESDLPLPLISVNTIKRDYRNIISVRFNNI